jgi:S-(hydroxymethyl)glutathione dehydrogenase/alcohol dehydrogenase
MKAAVLQSIPGELVIEDVAIEKPQRGEVLVRTAAAGLCHSDLHFMEGKYPYMTPTVPGHESAGVVEAVGEDVTYVQPGDHVITCLSVFCGHCDYCLSGRTNLCSNHAATQRSDGSSRLSMNGQPVFQFLELSSFGEYMLVHQNAVVKVTKDIPLDRAALIGCGVTTGVGAVFNTARVQAGSTVAVIGCGGVGQAVIQGARIAGAGRIIAIDPQPLKQKMAKQLGATDVVDPSKGDAVEQVKALTGGRGADYAFEVIGLPETIATTYQLARRGGEVIIVGMARFDAQFTLPAFGIFFEQKTVKGCKYGSAQVRRDFPRFVDLIETGRLDISSMVSKTIKLEGVNDAFKAMEAGEVIRSVIA